MRQFLKDSLTKVIYFYMVDSTDHVTPETGLTLAVKVSTNGDAFTTGAGSAPTELEEGVYAYTPGATDVDKLGPVVFKATASGADPFLVEGVVLAYDPYDAVRLGITALPNAIAGAVSGLVLNDSETAYTQKAAVDAAAAALVANNLDHLVKVAKDTNWATTVTKESIIDILTSKDSNQTFARETDSIEAIRDKLPANLEDLSVTDTTGRVDVASIGGTLQTANDNGADINAILEDTGTTLPGTLATIDGHVSDTFDDVGDVQSTVDTILADTNELQGNQGDWVTAAGYAMPGDAMTLTADYNAAKTAAPTEAEIITALKAATGFTEGGTWTLETLFKIITAWSVGKWQDKDGESGTYQILDPDDGETVLIEITPSETTPQKVVVFP